MLAGCSVRTCKPPSRSATAPITPPITNPATTAATTRKSTIAPTIMSAIPLWFIHFLLRYFHARPTASVFRCAFLRLSLRRALSKATQDDDARHHHKDEHDQEDQTYRQEHHEHCPARGRGVHLADAHDGQVEPVEGQKPAYDRYPINQASHRDVGDHPEGRFVARVAFPHEKHNQKVRDGSEDEEPNGASYGSQDHVGDETTEAVVHPLEPDSAHRLALPGEPEKSSQNRGDLDADQGEDEGAEEVAAPWYPGEELGRSCYHPAYHLHKATHGVREVVVTSGRSWSSPYAHFSS